MAGRVIVLGSVNVDLVVRTAALPMAGETVAGSSVSQSPGGKGANQAVAAARAGAAVVLCAAVGTDGFGDAALSALADDDVDTGLVARVEEPTGVAFVTVEDSGENQIVVVAGANLRAVGRGVRWRPGDVALAVLEVPMVAVEEFFADARAAGAMTVLNAAPATSAAARLLPFCDVVCVNEAELASLGGSVAGASLVVTLGAAGIRLVDPDGEFSLVAHPVEVIDTVGAGDATCVWVPETRPGVLSRRFARRDRILAMSPVRPDLARAPDERADRSSREYSETVRSPGPLVRRSREVPGTSPTG